MSGLKERAEAVREEERDSSFGAEPEKKSPPSSYRPGLDEARGWSGRVSLLAVFLLSAVMLILELLFPLVLLFLPDRSGSATIIAIVMLGLGVGGIVYYLLHEHPSAATWTERGIALLPFFILAGFFICALTPGQAAKVVTLMVPFALISLYLSRAFVLLASTRVYFVNLLGSGLGAILVFAFQPLLGEENGILLCAGLAAVAAFISTRTPLPRGLSLAGLLIALLLLGINLLTERFDLVYMIPGSRVPAERAHDALSFAFRAVKEPTATRVATSRNLVARVDVVRDPNYQTAQRFFSEDLKNIADPAFRTELEATLESDYKLYYMDHLWSQVVRPEASFSNLPPYNLLDRPRVLVIGPGGGVDIARAHWHQARRIVAAEINPGVIKLMRGPLREISGGVYDWAEVHALDGRALVRLLPEEFDLIHLAFADLYVPLGTSDIFTENYLYTLEAFQDYFRRLSPQGMIAVYKWVRSASWNKDLFRIAATCRAMLEAEGIADPGAHLFMAGMEGQPQQYLGYFLIKKSAFTPAEVQTLRQSVREPLRIYYAPGLSLPDSPFAPIILAKDFRAYLASLPFEISPITDDRPLFYLFDRSLSRHRGFFYLFLAVIAITILIPFGVIVVRHRQASQPRFWLASLFFSLIGLGYLFLQTTLLQKFNLYLGSPTLSLALVITAFLVFGGIGSEISRKLPATLHLASLLLAGILGLCYAVGLNHLLALALVPSLLMRSVVTLAFLVPLCLAVGMPFPQALNRVKTSLGERNVALLFGLNAAAGSLAVALFTRLLPTTGIHKLFLAGALLYFVAAALFPWLASPRKNA